MGRGGGGAVKRYDELDFNDLEYHADFKIRNQVNT